MIDRIDQRIIKELQKDGRQSYRRIAKTLHVAEGTVRSRVRRLVKEGTMKLSPSVDPEKLGYHFFCVIGLEIQLAYLDQVSKELARLPNMYYLAHTTGYFDLVAIALFRNPEELSALMRNNISQMSGVTRTQTFVAMDTVKKPWKDDLDVSALLGLPNQDEGSPTK
ncbi:MAG: Lrp/AsnC family transcriptional regulator [Dehalococcoidia bacterium]